MEQGAEWGKEQAKPHMALPVTPLRPTKDPCIQTVTEFQDVSDMRSGILNSRDVGGSQQSPLQLNQHTQAIFWGGVKKD